MIDAAGAGARDVDAGAFMPTFRDNGALKKESIAKVPRAKELKKLVDLFGCARACLFCAIATISNLIDVMEIANGRNFGRRR